MPHAYQPNSLGTRKAAGAIPDRRDAGLPRQGFVFCCFNSSNRITPDVFDAWMRILGRVEGSVLWLLEGEPVAVRNLRREATARGISAERIVFAPRAPVGAYLARYACADLVLDTFHYNGHTTGSDALLMGVPVVTRRGGAFASRVGASLLAAVGCQELVAHTTADYERLAVGLARDPAALIRLRDKLVRNVQVAPLFDARRYARNLESAYAEMWRRHGQGLAPDHIIVCEDR
jgi:predicted O-linked N-acetylglucosamine transferase (SPINDLY family)